MDHRRGALPHQRATDDTRHHPRVIHPPWIVTSPARVGPRGAIAPSGRRRFLRGTPLPFPPALFDAAAVALISYQRAVPPDTHFWRMGLVASWGGSSPLQAAVFHGPGDSRIEDRPRPTLETPSDAILRITHSAICGSDLWYYRGQAEKAPGNPIGHEPLGIVESIGTDVTSVEAGDRVFAPFRISCGECEFCRTGLQTSCADGSSGARKPAVLRG